jgi:hypothetical protein
VQRAGNRGNRSAGDRFESDVVGERKGFVDRVDVPAERNKGASTVQRSSMFATRSAFVAKRGSVVSAGSPNRAATLANWLSLPHASTKGRSSASNVSYGAIDG